MIYCLMAKVFRRLDDRVAEVVYINMDDCFYICWGLSLKMRVFACVVVCPTAFGFVMRSIISRIFGAADTKRGAA